MKKLLLALSICVFPGTLLASDVNPTKITKILVGPQYGNKVFLTISNQPSGATACQTNSLYRYVFDGTTPTGKMTLSVALVSYASQKDVWLGGSNSCTIHAGVENLTHIVTK